MLIRSEADRLAHVLSGTDPERPVPSCPGWTAADLLWHVTEVHEFWSTILASGALTEEDARGVEAAGVPRPDCLSDIQRRRENATTALLDQLDKRGDTEPAWTWLPTQQTVGFTRRMQMHEATIHRVDAQLTAGVPVLAPLAHTANDGLAHLIDVMWTAAHHWVPDGADVETLAVLEVTPTRGPAHRVELSRAHSTGTDGTEDHRVLARRARPGAEDSLPDGSVTGSAPALYLWAWGRGAALPRLDTGPERFRLDGDAVAITAAENLVAQGIE